MLLHEYLVTLGDGIDEEIRKSILEHYPRCIMDLVRLGMDYNGIVVHVKTSLDRIAETERKVGRTELQLPNDFHLYVGAALETLCRKYRLPSPLDGSAGKQA